MDSPAPDGAECWQRRLGIGSGGTQFRIRNCFLNTRMCGWDVCWRSFFKSALCTLGLHDLDFEGEKFTASGRLQGFSTHTPPQNERASESPEPPTLRQPCTLYTLLLQRKPEDSLIPEAANPKMT